MLTMKQHAEKALAVQDACNAHGVVVSLEGWFSDFAQLHPKGGWSTDDKNGHPITVLYVDKLASLAGCQALGHDRVMRAYREVYELTKEKEANNA